MVSGCQTVIAGNSPLCGADSRVLKVGMEVEVCVKHLTDFHMVKLGIELTGRNTARRARL